MAVEHTLSIIKPDAVTKNVIGEIYSRFEKGGLEIVAAKMMHLSQAQAEGFYAVHKERPFFGELVEMNVEKLQARYPGGSLDVHNSEVRVEGDI